MAIIGSPTNLNISSANSGTTYTKGPLSYSVLDGNNTIYADYQNVNFNLLGVMNITQSIDHVTLHLGVNTVHFGSENNVVYGNIRDLTISISEGGASDGNTHPNVMENNSISMGGNDIFGGNENNVVYGNMRDLSLSAGGNKASNGSTSYNQFDGSTFIFGNNTISLGNGNNVIYGVMRDLSLVSTGSEAEGLNSLAVSGVGDWSYTTRYRISYYSFWRSGS